MLKKLVKMGNKIGRRRPLVDEQFTKPQGLYVHKDLDHKKLRKLILAGHLAPCYVGSEESSSDLEECPICFLYYPSLNRSKCCAKGMCTECFLQMKAPQITRPTQCPFCKTPSYCVEYKGAKTIEEKGREQAEEQKVIEAKIRIRLEEQEQEQERVRKREQDILEGRIPLPPPPPPPAAGDPLPDLPLAVSRNWLAAESTTAAGLLARLPSQSEHGSSSSTSGVDNSTLGRGATSQVAGSSDRSLSSSGWSVFGTVGRPPLGRADGARGNGPRGLFRTETVRAIEADSLWFRSGASGESTPSSADTAYALATATATPGFLTRSAISPPHPHEAAPFGSPMSTDGSISTPFSHFQRSVGSTPFPRWEEGPEFDMDLEEIMIMEAIWQSLRLGEGSSAASEGGASSSGQVSSPDGGQRLSAAAAAGARSTGGLAGAIAALAERQAESSSSRLSTPVARLGSGQSSTGEHTAGASAAELQESNNTERLNLAEDSRDTGVALSSTSTGIVRREEGGGGASSLFSPSSSSPAGAPGGGHGSSSDLIAAAVSPRLHQQQQQQDVAETCSEEMGVSMAEAGETVPTEDSAAAPGLGGVAAASSTVTAPAPAAFTSMASLQGSPPEMASEASTDVADVGEGMRAAVVGDSHATKALEVGVDCAGSTTSSTLGLKGPDGLVAAGGIQAVPESFEDQIMYAIALSLAEVEAGLDGVR